MFIVLIVCVLVSLFIFQLENKSVFFYTENYKNFLINYKRNYEIDKDKFNLIYNIRNAFYTCLLNNTTTNCCYNIDLNFKEYNVSTNFDEVEEFCKIFLSNFKEDFILK